MFFLRDLWPGRIPPNAAISHLHAAPWASRLNAPPCVRGGRPWRARPHHHIFRSVLGHMPVISNTLVLIVGWIFV